MQDELSALRKQLREAENARDSALEAEAALRARLDAERAHVGTTMAAAENILKSLKSIENDQNISFPIKPSKVTFADTPATLSTDQAPPAASPLLPPRPPPRNDSAEQGLPSVPEEQVQPSLQRKSSKIPAVTIPTFREPQVSSTAAAASTLLTTNPVGETTSLSVSNENAIKEQEVQTSTATATELPKLSSPTDPLLRVDPELTTSAIQSSDAVQAGMSLSCRLPSLPQQRGRSVAGGLQKMQSMRYPVQPHTRRTWSLEIPRNARALPDMKPPSSRLLQSVFSGSLHAPAPAAVQRAISKRATLPGGDEALVNSTLTDTIGTARVPQKIETMMNDAHRGEIFAIAASMDGSLLASGGDDRSIRIVSLTQPGPPAVIAEPLKSVTALEWLPDLTPVPTTTNETPHTPLLCAGTSDGAVRLFKRNVKRRRWSLELVLPVHTNAVRRLRYCAEEDPAYLLSASNDRTLRLTDIRAGRRVHCVTAPSAALDVVPLPATGGEFLSAHRDGALRVWCMNQPGVAIESARVHSRAAIAIAPLDDARAIVSLGRDNAIRICDIRMSLRIVRELEPAVDTVSDWHRLTAHDRFVYCGLGGTQGLGVWNYDTGKLVIRADAEIPRSASRDILEMVTSSFNSSAPPVLVPLWTNAGQFLCAHRSKQISIWNN